MASWPTKVFRGIGALAAGAVLSLTAARRRQRRDLWAQMDRLMLAAARPEDCLLPGPRAPDGLPAPVERYLQWALPRHQRIRLVRIRQTGRLRTDVRSSRWMSFNAQHTIAPLATAFVWDARIAVAPFLHIRVRDAFLEGQGSGQVSFLSALTIASDSGTPEMNSGSLHRYLAEAPWYPSALLPSAKMRCAAIDAHSATATLTDHEVSV